VAHDLDGGHEPREPPRRQGSPNGREPGISCLDWQGSCTREVGRRRVKAKTVAAVSAGGVVARKVGGRVQVVLVGNSKRDTWYLPKGGLSPGETVEQAAAREVREETGLDVSIVRPIRAIQYWFYARGARVHKTVHYFLMEPTGGDFSRRDWENDRAGWFDLADALAIMSYENEAEVVREAASMLDGDS